MEPIIAYDVDAGAYGERKYLYEGKCGLYLLVELQDGYIPKGNSNLNFGPFAEFKCINCLYKFWRYPDSHPAKIKALSGKMTTTQTGSLPQCIDCLSDITETISSKQYMLERIGTGAVADD